MRLYIEILKGYPLLLEQTDNRKWIWWLKDLCGWWMVVVINVCILCYCFFMWWVLLPFQGYIRWRKKIFPKTLADMTICHNAKTNQSGSKIKVSTHYCFFAAPTAATFNLLACKMPYGTLKITSSFLCKMGLKQGGGFFLKIYSKIGVASILSKTPKNW